MPNLITLILMFFIIPAGATEKATVTGEVFDLSGKNKLFDFVRYEEQKDGSIILRSEYKDLQGQVALIEKAWLKSGQLSHYEIEQKQTQENGKIEVKNKKVYFEKSKHQGKADKDVEDFPSNFVIGMTLIPHIVKNWSALMKGESLKTRFGVWSRNETVGFKLWKTKEHKTAGEDLVDIVMKPTSFIIRALVDPIHFTLSKEPPHRLISTRGRTLPKIKKDGQWVALDALIRYKTL